MHERDLLSPYIYHHHGVRQNAASCGVQDAHCLSTRWFNVGWA
jgi:hypothetical protein